MKEFEENILITVKAHSPHFVKKKQNAIRFGSQKTPYSIHPIWCAMTFLTETRLPIKLRKIGYQALLFHDILEDSNFPLANTNIDVYSLVKEMTFKSLDEEILKIRDASNFVKLLKLYDKTSNLLDSTWMSKFRKIKYVKYTKYLLGFVQNHYGRLNIVSISKAICDDLEKELV